MNTTANPSSPIAAFKDVVCQLPDGKSCTFRVRQLTPFDYAACGDAFGRLFGRIERGSTIAEMGMGCFGDAIQCATATAEPMDDEAKRVGLRGVRCPDSLSRVSLAFVEINLFNDDARRVAGKFIRGFTSLLAPQIEQIKKFRQEASTGAQSSTPSTSSSPSDTPPSSPAESPSPASGA